MHNGKQSKKTVKEKLGLLKRMAMGEDVTEAILKDCVPRITVFRIVDNNEEIAKITKDEVIWYEQRSYPDREIEGVSYSRAENLPIIETSELSKDSDKTKIEARKEPVIASRRQNINTMKLQSDQLRQTMKAKRDQANRFMAINQEFSSGWIQ